jgi:hypothetical protein
MKRLFLLITLFTAISSLKAQTQQIRGVVVDDISQQVLPGVVVVLQSVDPVVAIATDMDGKFQFAAVPIGRHHLRVSMLGYEELNLTNVLVTAGKEVVLSLNMVEAVTSVNEVTVTAQKDRSENVNTMSAVSTRTFSVEETQKFAAAVNDPGRMAMSFAGVVGGSDGSNLISIRGNAPNGLLWRMEGSDIPNPNHFSSSASSGGGISILSAQLLDNSDFSTGAFSAEYGNALSGIFDLKLRKGNNQRREFTFQAGFLGIDLAAEGPLAHGGSYLINYRYSTLTLLGKIGVPIGDEFTNFQDISYNIFLPTKGKSSFELYGFSGFSSSLSKAERDTAKWESDWNRYESEFYSNTGAYGLKHIWSINNKAYLQNSLVYSRTYVAYDEQRLSDDLDLIREYQDSDNNQKYTLSSILNYKWNARHSGRFGAYLNVQEFQFKEIFLDTADQIMKQRLNASGSTETAQIFAQLKYRVNEQLSLLYGVHALYLGLNGSHSVEPRVALKYKVDAKGTLSLGYGKHSQIQPIGMYFALDERTGKRVNESLDLSRAHHLVLAYDRLIKSYMHVKAEVYFQHLYRIPVDIDPTSAFAAFNVVESYITRAMDNGGIGRNYGLELTVERYTHNNFYFLFSASLYDSRYKANDGVWRNTRFNANRSATLTTGKEYNWNRRGKARVVGCNLRLLYNDGMRTTPIDVVASKEQQTTVVKEDLLFTTKAKEYFRIDARVSVRRDYKKVTTTVALDIQNATNHKNEHGSYYDPTTDQIEVSYQVPLIPILSYKVEF